MQLPEFTKSLSTEVLYEQSPLNNRLAACENPASRWLGEALAQVWYEFNQQLLATDIIAAIEGGTVNKAQYLAYLRNMRQQVSQGARWLTRAASSMENSHVLLRNALISHAKAEHQDFLMLEKDYVYMGGALEDIQTQPMNIGSEALSTFIMSEASKSNPVGIFGATFIVEGLGSHKASLWSSKIQNALDVDQDAVSFLYYHGLADEDHYDNLVKVLSSPFITPQVAIEARRIAKIVGRLYALQLAELDNY